MHIDDYDFELPDSAIAMEPAPRRDDSRLLVLERASGGSAHRRFREIESLLRRGDLLVVNDTKVLPARLFGEDDSGRRFEIFLLAPENERRWRCLAKPGKRIVDKGRLVFGEGMTAELERAGNEFRATFHGDGPFLPWLERNGLPPLPPYIKRPATDADRQRYQTVYAREPGSVAAPTAGLHFTPELLAALEGKGIAIARVTLHVGYGTFAPIRGALAEHTMHEELYRVPEETLAAVRAAKAGGGRVVAVGTTSLRALESAATRGPVGSTDLFITPGYRFLVVDGLVTNFHLPKSSLFVLVCSLLGIERAKAAYADALAEGYRFYSYGDAMAIL